MKKHVYLLPGREETFADNLAKSIESLGLTLCGREIVRDFARLRFAEQLALIKSDLQTAFWKPDAKIVARSYGAYLLLNTLAEMNPFPGEIMLLSPVLGAADANDGCYVSRPPRAERFVKLIASRDFPCPRYLEIHPGAQDNGCDPSLAKCFASMVVNTKLHIVAGASHNLGEEYTRRAVRNFLSEDAAVLRLLSS